MKLVKGKERTRKYYLSELDDTIQDLDEDKSIICLTMIILIYVCNDLNLKTNRLEYSYKKLIIAS